MNADAGKLTAQEVREMSAAILDGGHRLGRLFENYLIYAQIELFASAPEQAQLLRNTITGDSDLIVHNVAMQQADKAGRPQDLVLETERVAIPLSPENLTKIVEELVSNAFKFSEAGTRVYVKSARERDTFVLYVRDHGRGMARSR
jgi:signal transduction histidine kinase